MEKLLDWSKGWCKHHFKHWAGGSIVNSDNFLRFDFFFFFLEAILSYIFTTYLQHKHYVCACSHSQNQLKENKSEKTFQSLSLYQAHKRDFSFAILGQPKIEY